jgi:phosphoglycolate phosphatase
VTSTPATLILFDWNGTVVLDTERARNALNGVLTARDLAPLDLVGFGREFHLPMAQMFRRLGAIDAVDAEAEWNAAMVAIQAPMRDGGDVLPALRDLGVRLGVVSAADATSVRADLKRLQLEDLWHTVDTSVHDKLTVLRQRRGVEEVALYVGDTEYDMRCAREAGYVAVAVSDGYRPVGALRDAGANHVVASLAELLPLVSSLMRVQQPSLAATVPGADVDRGRPRREDED